MIAGDWTRYTRRVMPMTWPDIPELYAENYNHCTALQIQNHPKKWLDSLPMFEYAFMLVVNAAQAYGGPWEQYYNDLYCNYMMPILEAYYKRLMKYRYHRAILMRNYDSMRKILKGSYVMKELEEMQCYAAKTRTALRCVVQDFRDVQTGVMPGPRPVEDTLPDKMLH